MRHFRGPTVCTSMTKECQPPRLRAQQDMGKIAIDPGGTLMCRGHQSLAYPSERHRSYPRHPLRIHQPAFQEQFPYEQ
jgi:hypothetical protein